jgi:hypothetical protein
LAALGAYPLSAVFAPPLTRWSHKLPDQIARPFAGPGRPDAMGDLAGLPLVAAFDHVTMPSPPLRERAEPSAALRTCRRSTGGRTCRRTRRAAVTGMIDAIALHEAAHAITALCEECSTALRSVAVNNDGSGIT